MISHTQVRRRAKQIFNFCHSNGSLDENCVRQVVRYVATAGYRECPAVLGCLYRLVRLDVERHTANIESATPLPADLQASLEAGLTRRYRSALAIAFDQRPSLIGGMRIQVGCDLFDATVLAGLEALEKSF